MLRIAICDDDQTALSTHKEIAEKCIKQCGSIGQIDVYASGSNLLYDITEDHFYFDLILLDIEEAIRLISLEDGKAYTIQTNSRLEKIPYREILYIERDGKNAGFVTEKGVSKVRKSLGQVYEELDAEEFIYIDRGCIVNMIHIMQVRDGMALLKNGISLPISRSHLLGVKEQINQYWGTHI
ncbi:MAG: LytTR family transcriptional regulator DNA-binding domain-containing protein [Lachnospiraceae bacterium]|nr:LytTR family transcriptional regulator DNA-binding domain-containing protein [Lachnospiraceae bacterium]